MGGLSPEFNFPSHVIARYDSVIGGRKGDETIVRSVGTNQDVDPRFDKTMAGEGFVCERDLVLSRPNTGQQITDAAHSSSPKHTAPAIPGDTISMGSHNRGDQEADMEAPMASTLDQQRLPLQTSVAKPRSDHGGASSVPHGVVLLAGDMAKQTDSEFDRIPRSSPIPNSSQPEPEMRPSTPPSSREMPGLASPVQLQAEPNLHSTPPSSPMKLSSPPPLKPMKKAVLRTGLGAPFRSPFRRPIPCALPSSSLPPSSPPPLPASSPQRPPAKKRRAESPPEDRPVASKVRRTGPSVFPSAPFVSPLRNSQGEGATKSRARPPAGGFSTPLRPSKIQRQSFSSPAVPTEPDVFTTSATAYRLSAPPSSDPASEADATPARSSSGTSSRTSKPRPSRVAAARPFKPPAKSTRPTSATVQALKQRLQSLRNALRIRGIADPTRPASTQPAKVMDDGELEALALRWRNAAREAAQDLWALVKDSAGGDSWSNSGKEKEDAWGWDAKSQRGYQRARQVEQNLGDVETDKTFTPPDGSKVYRAVVKKLSQPFVPRKTMLPPYEDAYEFVKAKEGEMECSENEKEDEPEAHTLGTMLTSLGIPHEVLGWQEEEGEFAG
ncbi:hypothetical protein FS749_006301 [Ceratobasidium sp. UAMH 11750]|nr:hypothetical protein FS749_006301 [Ceratobasidium sp. UAMH 11750]